jgi:chorismate synthase
VTRGDIEASLVRCPEPTTSKQMITLIEQAMKEGDSLGGVIECIVRGVTAGIGSPVFDKLEAKLAAVTYSINIYVFGGVEIDNKDSYSVIA